VFSQAPSRLLLLLLVLSSLPFLSQPHVLLSTLIPLSCCATGDPAADLVTEEQHPLVRGGAPPDFDPASTEVRRVLSSSSSCYDKYSDCGKWKSEGYCYNEGDDKKGWM